MKVSAIVAIGGLLIPLLFCAVSCSGDQEEGFTVRFDSRHEVSGMKIALEDISPGLPADWDGYEYVVLEFMITTPQRFQVGFITDEGYNELRVMSYTPYGWNQLPSRCGFTVSRRPPGAIWRPPSTSQGTLDGST